MGDYGVEQTKTGAPLEAPQKGNDKESQSMGILAPKRGGRNVQQEST